MTWRDPRIVLIAAIVAVWSALTMIDAFSQTYVMPEGVHVGAGGLVGVLIGSIVASAKGKGE